MRSVVRVEWIGLAAFVLVLTVVVGARRLAEPTPARSHGAPSEPIAERSDEPFLPVEAHRATRQVEPGRQLIGTAPRPRSATAMPRAGAREEAVSRESQSAGVPLARPEADAGPEFDARREKRLAQSRQRRERFEQNAIKKMGLEGADAEEFLHLLDLLRYRPGDSVIGSPERIAESQRILRAIQELVGPEKFPIYQEMQRRRRGGRRRHH